jgi:hypothetical protein
MSKCLAIIVLFLICGCEDRDGNSFVPPTMPIQLLLAAPETIKVDGRVLTLTADLWRDFMPSTDHGDHSQLIALVHIEATGTAQLPTSISSDAIWIVNGNEVWKSYFSDEQVLPAKPNRISRIARDGPHWDGYVEVIVRVLDSMGKGYLLRASHQQINKVY